MDHGTLGLASKLLNKAQSTNFDNEAAALTERAYRLLAEVLNDYESQAPAAGPGRKRERRNLRDRRSRPGSASPSAVSRMPNPMAAHIRRAEWIDSLGRGQVDLRI